MDQISWLLPGTRIQHALQFGQAGFGILQEQVYHFPDKPGVSPAAFPEGIQAVSGFSSRNGSGSYV